jgi:hypothetical protein
MGRVSDPELSLCFTSDDDMEALFEIEMSM